MNKITEKQFIGLIARCKDEFFVKEFCSYYLSQGVDQIHIIDDNSSNKSIYDGINNKNVIIHYDKDIVQKDSANMLYSEIKHKFYWMIYIDIDEFICTNAHSNITTKESLETHFQNSDCIKIPWVMMACNGRLLNPDKVLTENIHRWNHDLKHPNPIRKFRCRHKEIEVKCIFRPEKFKWIWDHHPLDPTRNNISIVNSINLEKELLTPFYQGLREKDIYDGKLLCYHYRVISKENSTNKIKTSFWYKKENHTVDDLHSTDYPEKIDTTLCTQAKQLNIYANF